MDKASAATTTTAPAATALPPPEQGLRCPRCDSPNTKFCYYNNYSLTQPRHFCKSCRRYWTKGGSLRNVPVGGGYRKAKKSKSDAAASSTFAATAATSSFLPAPRLSGFSVDFQLNPLPMVTFGDHHYTSPNTSVNYHPIPAVGFYNNSVTSSAANNSSAHTSIVSSIESLSSINQDLHWKLQQKRLAMLFGSAGENSNSKHCESGNDSVAPLPFNPLMEAQNFQLPENSKAYTKCAEFPVAGGASTAWFLENSFTTPSTTPTTTTPTNHSFQTWHDMHQFTTMP